jgi:hypothetical protein
MARINVFTEFQRRVLYLLTEIRQHFISRSESQDTSLVISRCSSIEELQELEKSLDDGTSKRLVRKYFQ